MYFINILSRTWLEYDLFIGSSSDNTKLPFSVSNDILQSINRELQARNLKFFGTGNFLEKNHCNKRFMNDIHETASQGKILFFFISKILLKLHFKWEFNP